MKLELTSVVAGCLCLSALGNPPDSPYGICAHLTGEEFGELDRSLDRISGLGVKWLRTDFRWWMCNGGDAVWKFDRFDAVVDAAERRGITLLPVLAGEPAGFRPLDEHLDEWTNFVQRVVSRYAGRVRAWEVLNEVNHPNNFGTVANAAAYVKVLRATYRAVKAMDPNASVLAAGMAGVGIEYLEEMFRNGAADCCDVLSVHPYSYPLSPEDKSYGNLRHLQQKLDEWGWHVPVWQTEFGFATQLSADPSTPSEADERQQADYLARMLGIAGAMGIARSFYYELRSAESDPYERESHFGLLHWDFSEKPAYASYRTFAAMKPDGSESRSDVLWTDGNGTFFPQWTRTDGEPAGMLWTTGEEETREFQFSNEDVGFYDCRGESVDFDRCGWRVWVRLSGSPVYFRCAELKIPSTSSVSSRMVSLETCAYDCAVSNAEGLETRYKDSAVSRFGSGSSADVGGLIIFIK